MQKTWGPFTGRQLTAIVLGLIAAILVPGAAYAVDSFTNVAIEDPVSGAKASVDATHHVLVGDGSGPVTVDGTVTDHEAPYNTLKHWAAFGVTQDIGCQTIAAVGTSRGLVVKSIHIDTYVNPSPGSGQAFYLYYGPASSPCSNILEVANPPGIGPTVLDLGAGVALPAGNYLSVQAGGSVAAEFTAYGFTIASSQAPAAAPAAKAATPQQK
jgi:hypothetical protein